MLRSIVAWHMIGSAHSDRNQPLSPSRSRSPSYQPERETHHSIILYLSFRKSLHRKIVSSSKQEVSSQPAVGLLNDICLMLYSVCVRMPFHIKEMVAMETQWEITFHLKSVTVYTHHQTPLVRRYTDRYISFNDPPKEEKNRRGERGENRCERVRTGRERVTLTYHPQQSVTPGPRQPPAVTAHQAAWLCTSSSPPPAWHLGQHKHNTEFTL